MTEPLHRSVDEILGKFKIGFVVGDRDVNDHLLKFKQALHAATIAALPEKKDATNGKDYMFSPETKIAVANYNQAIEQMRAAVDRMYGVES